MTLRCFVKTLNLIVDAIPKGRRYLEIMSRIVPNTCVVDKRYYEAEVCSYGKNKLVLIVQRRRQKYQLVLQLKFENVYDPSGPPYVYSDRWIEFSSDDDIDVLRNFANSMSEKYIEYGNFLSLSTDEDDAREIPDFENLR